MLRFIFSVVALSILVGCGGGSDVPELGEVSGVVKVDGSPKADLIVTFSPEKGRPSAGRTNENGEYDLTYSREDKGAIVGKNVVTITTDPTDMTDDGCGSGCGGNGSGCGCGQDAFVEPIHPKYNTQAKSNPEMTVEVKPGSQEFNFDVETDPSAGRGKKASGRRNPSCCSE